jgi:hypothetical protein
MNGAKSSAQAAARWMVWVLGSLGIVLCALMLLIWGLYGPTYILDLIAAYCGL